MGHALSRFERGEGFTAAVKQRQLTEGAGQVLRVKVRKGEAGQLYLACGRARRRLVFSFNDHLSSLSFLVQCSQPGSKQQVVGLIHEYQAAVYRAVALLNKSKQEKGFQRPQESPGVWAGYPDDLKQVRSSFHGSGCIITRSAFQVDFDYGGEGGCTGIDTWFMVDSLKSNLVIQAKYPLLTNGEISGTASTGISGRGLANQVPVFCG
ncbi:hypothetical protein IC235_01110 [Hymenobacter sp. BT664]|uniref:DUF6896 domain-containing protein n=1 Tax=Hymenobacter montanus TaxID=2771359 RepID=A0A927BAE5_9BACT|nr:hypothetical protein [Hymenobacter montanus]MBD2766487.1 hypothetical protein [Hymenobacter montanus]